jgi:MFS transporter, DHA1 family, inner membrane transport protein
VSEVRAHATEPGIYRIVVPILIGVVAALVVNSLPVFLTVLARARGLSEGQSGLIAFADMGGIAVGTTFCALSPRVMEYLTWRWVAGIGLLLLCAANLLSIVAPGFTVLLAARALAGCGSGMAMAVTYAILAEGHGARALAVFNVAQLAGGWLGIPLLGPIAARYGAGGLFGVIGTLALGALFLCVAIPRGQRGSVPSADTPHEKLTWNGWLAIASVFLYFAGAGAIYGYLSFMGIAWGGRAGAVESGLSTIMFAAMTGGIVVSVVGSRFGFTRPMYAGFAVLFVSIVLLAAVQPVQQFVLFGCVFGFAWNIVTPYQFEAVTLIDESSSAAMLVNAATLGGLAVGPAVAGFLATPTYFRVNMLALGTCVVSLALLVCALRMRGTAVRRALEGASS